MEGFGVIHSGHGAEYGGEGYKKRCWSIKASGVMYQVPGGLGVINKYYTTSAFHGRPPSTDLLRIGTLSHELGHSLGMSDLYDTSWAGKGIGNYDLMAYGNFGFDSSGYYPSSLSAYHKLYTGWATHEDITANGEYTIESGIHQVYKIAHGFPSGEYLLLENRQPVGYDSRMNGGGIAIYHVDEKVRKQKFPGYPGMPGFPENRKHYRVALLASNQDYALERGTTKGAGGDLLWHSGSTLTELTDIITVFPNTMTYKTTMASTGVRIKNFSASNATMTFEVEGITSDAQPARLRAGRGEEEAR